MKTFMANAQNVERQWFVVDATNMPLGRLASQVASILAGKNKPTYTPHVDTGDYVIVINSDKVVLTGNKLDDKIYRHHSAYLGGMKERTAREVMENNSDFVVTKAVKGMLPRSNLGREMLKKLKVFKGAEHNHTAQQPIEIKLVGGRY